MVNMSSIHYKLTDDQYISDLNLQLNPDHYLTHLCADTGMGKSSWVMEQLTQQTPIIFAVPQRAQIMQLQNRYGGSNEIDFIYGGHTQLSDDPLHIVCTYDQLPMLQAELLTHHYLLVVDEVHKLYQAASYREEAVLNLIDAIRDERFSQVVTMSATFTPQLVPYRCMGRSVPSIFC
jgi:superfamily II DNA or RNA helicase